MTPVDGIPGLDDAFHASGVRRTGDYAWPAVTPRQIAEGALGERLPAELVEQMRLWHLRYRRKKRSVIEGVDEQKLEQAGWGLVLPSGASEDRIHALRPLIEHRESQTGRQCPVFVGENGVLPHESKSAFLRRLHVGAGPVDPANMPYYLLLAASPEEISFEFQRQLDVAYAVGRICFDSHDDYRAYAEKVRVTEEAGLPERPSAAFFSAEHAGDRATRNSTAHLITPLVEIAREDPRWQVRAYLRESATKKRLSQLLHGDEPTHFLMTAGHGMAFSAAETSSHDEIGALLCSDWTGGALRSDCYYSARDFVAGNMQADNSALDGSSSCPRRPLVTFHFACHSGGVPARDSFPHRPSGYEPPPRPHLARLPQAMLAAPTGGAIASIAHLDRAWSCSFLWPDAGPQIQLFRHTITQILSGRRLGSALEAMHATYAELVSDLDQEIDQLRHDADSLLEISRLWTASADIGNFLLFGDPAVRAAKPGVRG